MSLDKRCWSDVVFARSPKVEPIRTLIRRYLYIFEIYDHADIQFIHIRQTVKVNIKLGNPLYM